MRVGVTLCLVFLLAVSAVAQVDLGDDAVSQAAIQIAEKLVAAAEPRSGEVVEEDWNDIQHPTIYVTLGGGDGVGEGTILDIIGKGEPIKVGDEVIGFRENPAGTATITRVQSEKLAVARVETIVPNKRPGKGCLAYVKTVPRNLAMCAFHNSDKSVSRLGRELADKVGAALTGTGKFTVIERPQLEELLGGPEASSTDLLHPEKSLLLAPKVPARALVTGTIAKQNDRYVIAVRVLEIGAGLPLGATTATMARSDEADGKYADARGGTGGGGGTATTEAVPLFDTLEPFEGVPPARAPLGTVSIAGRLHDDCVGYAAGSRNMFRTDSYQLHYDLKGHSFAELRAVLGWADRLPNYQTGAFLVHGDGKEIGVFPAEAATSPGATTELRVPLAGVRQLTITFAPAAMGMNERAGLVAVEDFELIPAE